MKIPDSFHMAVKRLELVGYMKCMAVEALQEKANTLLL